MPNNRLPLYLRKMGFELLHVGYRTWGFSYESRKHPYEYKSKKDAVSMIKEWTQNLSGLEMILGLHTKEN